MIRILIAAAALGLAAPALACGGDAPCDKEHCKMKPATEVETAMAEVEAAEGTKVSLSVSGMTCGSCSDRVTAALKGIEGVNAAAVSHAEGVAKVAIDASKTDVDKLIAAIDALGKFKASKAES